MLAVALCIGLFGYWTVLGYAAVTALNAGRSRLQDLLVAPAVGLVVLVLSLFTLSRFGWPVKNFGPALGVVLLVAAGGLLWRNRPRVPWGEVWPFGLVLVVALLATGGPMFRFGFDWVSFCNDDMANYALAGDRFYWDGYFQYPDPDNIARSKYFGQDFWFMHVATNTRPGCELVMAWLRSVTRLDEHRTFMPLILSFHLGLILAVGAIVMSHGPDERDDETEEDATAADENEIRGWRLAVRRMTTAPVLTCGMLSVSALVSLGTFYQLIAQVAGLMLLAVNAVLLLRPFRGMTRGDFFRHAGLLGLAGAGLLVIYSEVVPFLGLAWLGYLAVFLVRRRVVPWGMAGMMAVAGVVAFALTRRYFFSVVEYVLGQSRRSTTTGGEGGIDAVSQLFPYYMLPEGLGDFWGLFRIARWEEEPWQSIKIVVAGLLLIAAVVAAVWLCWRGRPAGFIAAALWVLAALLFKQRSGFGLFKLAMFAQPFAVAALVAAWVLLVGRRRDSIPWLILRVAPLVALAAAGLNGQRAYAASSLGNGTAFLEMPNPSRWDVVGEFRRLIADDPHPVVISDTYNGVIGKFQALYTRGRELVFLSRPFFQTIDSAIFTNWKYLDPEPAAVAESLAQRRAATLLIKSEFDLKEPSGLTNRFLQTDLGHTAPGAGADALFVKTTPRLNLFNRRWFPEVVDTNFQAVPYPQVRNHLVFVASRLGPPYSSQGVGDILPTLYRLEDDTVYFSGDATHRPDTMAGIGRHLLFQAINPAPKVRVALDMSCSLLGGGHTDLPPAEVVGAERVKFPVAGKGSMRVFSPPLELQDVRGRKYLMLDLGTPGRPLGVRRTGLMNWFGKDVTIDLRVIVGFARDVSLVSEEEYQNLTPPSRIDGFPAGRANPLRNKDLEYSGLYEDGWVADECYLRLAQPEGTQTFVVTGLVDPSLAGANQRRPVELSVDGRPVPIEVVQGGTSSPDGSIGTGEFSIRATVPPADGGGRIRTIRLKFAGPLLHLPDPDNRPAAALLQSIGFDLPPSRIDGLLAGGNQPQLALQLANSGLSTDGWASDTVRLRLTRPAGVRAIVVKGQVPLIGGNDGHRARVELLLDGKPVPVRVEQPGAVSPLTTGPSSQPAELTTVGVGEFVLRAAVPDGGPAGGVHAVELRWVGPLLELPPPDGRKIAAQLYQFGYEP